MYTCTELTLRHTASLALQGAVEIDQRAVAFLREKLPELHVTHQDVLHTDWAALAQQRGGPLNLIGNLPYYITSQILFSLADRHESVQSGVFTTQLEVSEWG
jgi:16S rRNA (adenine1518-N6/adenine1519-N6)-dimethyltransferase